MQSYQKILAIQTFIYNRNLKFENPTELVLGLDSNKTWSATGIQAVFQKVRIHEVLSAVSLTRQSTLCGGASLASNNSSSLCKILDVISMLTMYESWVVLSGDSVRGVHVFRYLVCLENHFPVSLCLWHPNLCSSLRPVPLGQ